MEEQYLIQEEAIDQESKTVAEKKKTDPHISIIAMQCIVCGIIILTFFVIKFFFSGLFEDISSWYIDNVKAETEIEETFLKGGMGGPVEIENTVGEGGFVLPIEGTVTSYFGYRLDPFTGKAADHSGIDIAAPENTPIYSALEGVVVTSEKDHSDYGNYIVIEHGGFSTLYGHCESLAVEKGQQVSAGQVIARCGSTGRSTGPHLHFEVRVKNIRIDPTPFLNLSKING